MAECFFDSSFNEDESKFYSDHEYEEFLKNFKRNLQLLDSKSDQGCSHSSNTETINTVSSNNKPENSFNDIGEDASHIISSNTHYPKSENFSAVEENLVLDDKNDSDFQFENFILGLKSALDEEDEKESPNSTELSNDSTGDSEEENMFEKFLTQMSENLNMNNVKTPKVLQPSNSVPLRSRSLSSKTDSLDKVIHPRSQSTSKIQEFSLSKAKAQAEHDFMLKRKFYAEQMYKFFNYKVFNNKLPNSVLLKWNGKMKSTAGLCKCSRKNTEYSFHIELSPSVLLSFDRLQDTLIHEMCHAACWMINHSRDNHGQLWKTWADRCNLILPDVQVPTTCHSYELSYAFVLKCTKCAFERKRHKMCEKLQRTTCPCCKAPTELKRL